MIHSMKFFGSALLPPPPLFTKKTPSYWLSDHLRFIMGIPTVYPKKYAHGCCFAVLCCGYTLTDFPISIRLTSLALWQSNDCPSASKATLMNMDKYFMWIHCERLHNHNKAKHNIAVCIFLGIYCIPSFLFLIHYQNTAHSQWLIFISWDHIVILGLILDVLSILKGVFFTAGRYITVYMLGIACV